MGTEVDEDVCPLETQLPIATQPEELEQGPAGVSVPQPEALEEISAGQSQLHL